MNFKDSIATIPNFPKQGIVFRDVSPLLADPKAFHAAISAFASEWKGKQVDKIAGFDARGFIFGAALALKLGVPFVMLRKKGKLPGKTVSVVYGLEYGAATLEMQKGAVAVDDQVLLVDDLLATGGTAEAGATLVEAEGGTVVGFAFIVELTDLSGRAKIAAYPIQALVSFKETDGVCVESADVIATLGEKLVLIERLTEPKGLALPGGKVEKGEEPEATAKREFAEETGLSLRIEKKVGVYDGKGRDPRFDESKSTVFIGVAAGVPKGEQGKTKVHILSRAEIAALPKDVFAFDHHRILDEYLRVR